MMNTELFVDSTGRHVEIHERNDDCLENGCAIHNPSDHPLRDAPLVWRVAGPFDIKPSHMERICAHGVGHPDHDSLNYLRRTDKSELADGLAAHGCDGCCTRSTKEYDLGDILSVTTGRLVSPRHMTGLYDLLGYMTNSKLTTIGLVMVADSCRESLLQQHPDLAYVTVPDDVRDEQTATAWLTTAKRVYGETRAVARLGSA